MSEWDKLNKRQQAYLAAIYEVDQEQEEWERGAWNRGNRPRKAEVWRWMDYATLDGVHTPLKMKLYLSKMIDPGTGSTFEALETRRLITCRYSTKTRNGREVLGEYVLAMQITPLGRKVVREGQGKQAKKKLPTGTLREWHWKALALAWKAQPKGILKEVLYANISWNTWLRLRDYKDGDLVYEREVRRPNPSGWHFSDYYMCLTAFGKQYYRDNWQRYREMYPDVDAPDPT